MLPFEDRFTRQRQLPEVGLEGQRRLEAAVVSLADTPAGTVAGEYLARAGLQVDFLADPATEFFPEASQARLACSYRGPSDYLAGALLALRHVRTTLEMDNPGLAPSAEAAPEWTSSHPEE